MKKHKLKGFEYTNDDNPFGDEKISERFVWGKKIEKQLEEGADVRELAAKAEQRRQRERIEEIEKVKRRREEREAERAALEEELDLVQRERARAEAVELEKKEEEFHLEQAKIRAKQRLECGRPKAIDIITNNLFLLDGLDRTAEDPSIIVASLNLFQLQELKDDIIEYSALDSINKDHVPFWESLAKVAEHELAEAVKQEEIDRARVRGVDPPEKYQVREAGWHPTLEADIAEMLQGKTLSELNELEIGITEQLESGDAADPDYWTAVLRRLDLYKAKSLLREFHANIMEQELEKMRQGIDVPKALVSGAQRVAQAREEAERAQAELDATENKDSIADGENIDTMIQNVASAIPDAQENPEEIDIDDEEEEGEELEKLALQGNEEQLMKSRKIQELKLRGEPLLWDDISDSEQEAALGANVAGSFSPVPLAVEHTLGHDVIPEEEDRKMTNLIREKTRLQKSQALVKAAVSQKMQISGGSSSKTEALYRQMVENPDALTGSAPLLRYITDAAEPEKHPDTRQEAQLRTIAARSMGNDDGDATFGGEVDLQSQVYWWHEKYKPRKPKYFNRVHTGFDWTKYNKTHYDSDNPPPKMVVGYKFNIFYPDLIDSSKAPSYSIERDPSSPDNSTCILRFSGGPPYEDIAFRIVNKDWATDPKRGFKCVFDRGILQLYFNFRKVFYRR